MTGYPIEPPFLVTDALPVDADLISLRVRKEDIDEWAISTTEKFIPALSESIRTSEGCVTIFDRQDLPVLIAGGQPWPDGRVLTWMVIAQGLEDYGLALMKDYRPPLDAFLSRWPEHECFSDARNEVHHKWLRYLGYIDQGIVKWGPYGAPFIHFKYSNKDK